MSTVGFIKSASKPLTAIFYAASANRPTGGEPNVYEKSVIGPFFKEMGLDYVECATADYFFYTACTTLARLSGGNLRMRDSMPHAASVGGARSL